MIQQYDNDNEIIRNHGVDFIKMLIEHIGGEVIIQKQKYFDKNYQELNSARCIIVMRYGIVSSGEKRNACIDTHWVNIEEDMIGVTIFSAILYDDSDGFPDVVLDMYNSLKC